MRQLSNTHAQGHSGLDGDVDQDISYRPVCGLAVVALLLGLLSPLAFFWSILWLLPFLGVLVSALALRAIRQSDGVLAGRGLAVTGLVLSLVVGATVISAELTRKRLLVAQGTPWAVKWCELLLEGRTEEALELKQGPATRRSFTSLEKYYAENDSAKASLAEFREEPVIKLLTSAPKGSRVVPGSVVGVDRRATGEYGMVRSYTLLPPEPVADELPPVTFLIEVDKVPARGIARSGWYIRGYKVPDAASAAAR